MFTLFLPMFAKSSEDSVPVSGKGIYVSGV